MEKQTEVEKLKEEYSNLTDKIQLLEETMDNLSDDDYQGILMEDQWSAMRLYAKALFDRILYLDNIKDAQEKTKTENTTPKKETIKDTKDKDTENPTNEGCMVWDINIESDPQDFLKSVCSVLSQAIDNLNKKENK